MVTFETTQPLATWPGHAFPHALRIPIARTILFLLFKNKILLHSSGWPRTHYIAQAHLELMILQSQASDIPEKHT